MPLSKQLANALRFLSVDAVELAQSGHPGMPLGMADIAMVLWHRHLKHNPQNPRWFNRDRFVLSNGHGSMLLYALLHLTGYNLSLQDLKEFRQLHSKTPGHPEYMETPGVETTTGPLAQGLGNAVGMALAERVLAARYNKPEATLVDHHTYVFVGDGCLMEGLSHEACSLAGTLGLSKLIVFYDDNGISIDGGVSSWFGDDTVARFHAYHWRVIGPIDGHDVAAIDAAILEAKTPSLQPTLIVCKTTIGYGAPMEGSESTHGAPLGAEQVLALRERLGWLYPAFEIPDTLYASWNHTERGRDAEQTWLQLCHAYQQHCPDAYHEFLRCINGDLPDHWLAQTHALHEVWQQQTKAISTRSASQRCIAHYAALLPELFGGSADLTASNLTDWSGSVSVSRGHFNGNYVHYGVREFAMAAMMTGMALHGGLIPYGGTFLVFSDYARNAIRLSALMKQRVVYVLTHDSIGLGEDGPTHQPIEHAAMLRMTPSLRVWRPADGLETAVAWKDALEHHQATSCLLLSRQALPALTHTSDAVSRIQRGGYILHEAAAHPDVILMATGSEVQIALACARQGATLGLAVRVVSMPCPEQFLLEDASYQALVLPPTVRQRIAIEAGSTAYWYRFVGLDGRVVGLDCFGLSAPGPDVFRALGVTVEHTMNVMLELLGKKEIMLGEK